MFKFSGFLISTTYVSKLRYFLNSSDTGANEAMVRFAADLYFLLQRYEKALTLYKSVTSDFKEDKAFVHLGSYDGHRREIEHYFDLAVQRFHRKHPSKTNLQI